MKRRHPHALDTVTADAVHRALAALGINPIGLFSVEIGRVEGTLRIERLVTDAAGVYVINDDLEYATETHTVEIV